MYRFEIEINTTLVLVLLTVAAVGYAGWTVWFTMRESRRADGRGRKDGRSTSSSDNKVPQADIMGKSKFVLEQGVSLPQAAVAAESEPDTEKANTFAPETVPEHPRQIAPEELDEVFGKPPEGESNEPLEIDQPLYVEPSFPEEEADDDEDENEELPLAGRHSAQGVSYENLGEAYRRVVHNPIITEREKEETGRVLLDLRHTDMFEYIVSGSPTRENRVFRLMETYLAAFAKKRMSAEAAGSPSPPKVAPAPVGFDIRDYV
jgi:hypothetical protein